MDDPANSRIPFSFGSAVYPDPVYNINITISGSGNAVFSDGAVQSMSESEISELPAKISEAVVYAIGNADVGESYNMIPYKIEKLLPVICSQLADNIQPSGIEFSAFCPDEDSMAAIVKIKKEQAFSAVQAPAAVNEAPAVGETLPAPDVPACAEAASDAEVPADNTAGDKLVLVETGPRKMDVIKYLTNNFGFGLAMAKKIAESAPTFVAGGLSSSELDMHISRLAALNAKAERKL